ncbi:MAG: recombinase family protein, partial [Ottowia sp.]|nr:recombinase family protein [Ottowia sp.]
DEATTVLAMHRLGEVWEQLFPAEKHRLINLMVERVDLVPGGLKFKWHELGWQALIGEFSEGTIGRELLDSELAS